MTARTVRIDELVAVARTPYGVEELSTAHGTSAIVVDVDGARASDAIERLLDRVACVTVALGDGPLAPLFDLALEEDDHEPVIAAIEAHPIAATCLAVLLRHGESRSITAGLVAESSAYSVLQSGPEFATWRRSRVVRPTRVETELLVRTVRRGDELHITLDRPWCHNAFGIRLRDELVEALWLAATDDSITGVVLDGAGPSFCSGGDLDEFATFSDPASAHLVRLTRSAGALVAAMTERVEVHLHGACLGAGIEVPAFARTVVAHPDTVIALPEISLGLIPGAGGTVSIPRRIGRQRTAWMAITGARIDVETALSWGLVDAVVDHPMMA